MNGSSLVAQQMKDLELLLLWLRVTAEGWFQSLAQELLHVGGVAKKRKKKKNAVKYKFLPQSRCSKAVSFFCIQR